VHDAAAHVGHAGVDDTARVGLGEGGEVAEHRDDVVDVDAALDEALAGVLGLERRHRLLLLLEQVGEPVQQGRALGGGGARPRAVVEGAAGARDRACGVVGVTLGDGADGRSVGGADDVAHGVVVPATAVAAPALVDFGHDGPPVDRWGVVVSNLTQPLRGGPHQSRPRTGAWW